MYVDKKIESYLTYKAQQFDKSLLVVRVPATENTKEYFVMERPTPPQYYILGYTFKEAKQALKVYLKSFRSTVDSK